MPNQTFTIMKKFFTSNAYIITVVALVAVCLFGSFLFAPVSVPVAKGLFLGGVGSLFLCLIPLIFEEND